MDKFEYSTMLHNACVYRQCSVCLSVLSASTKHGALIQLRQWPNIKQTLDQREINAFDGFTPEDFQNARMV